MKRNKFVLFAGLAVLLIGIGSGIVVWMNHPMGQTLTLQTPAQLAVPESEAQPISKQAAPIVEKTSTIVATTPTNAQTNQVIGNANTCGNTGRMHLLVIGLTAPNVEEALGADAIRLVTIDFDQPSAAVVTLPVYIWVETPVLSEMGIDHLHLTTVYWKAYAAAKADTEQIRARVATQAVAQTIMDNFGYMPDHYITVNDSGFVEYVDALGGIDVDLPKAVDGTAEGYGIYLAGPQHLDGKHTLNFARLFHPNGVTGLDIWGNFERQNIVVKAVLDGMLKPQNWTKIPALVEQIDRAMDTDLSPDQLMDLACIAQKVGENTRMLTVDETMVAKDIQGRMIPDTEAIKSLIAEMDSSD